MDNPEKLATLGIQNKDKQNKNTTQYVVDTTMRKYTKINLKKTTYTIRYEPSYKLLVVKTNRTSFSCGNNIKLETLWLLSVLEKHQPDFGHGYEMNVFHFLHFYSLIYVYMINNFSKWLSAHHCQMSGLLRCMKFKQSEFFTKPVEIIIFRVILKLYPNAWKTFPHYFRMKLYDKRYDSIFTLWTFHLYVATFQQYLHMEYISLNWYDIPEIFVPIRISLIEGCC